MKLFILFITSGLILSGCNAITPKNENSPELLQENSKKEIEPGSDAYYLNIARDLFVAQQYKQAYQITAGLAEKNNIEAQYLLGYLYYYGQGVAVDTKQGEKWISISADSGYRPAIEALVLIKHGLTPDNKCSSVDLVSVNTENKILDNSTESNINEAPSLISDKPEKGEVLITPKNIDPIQGTEKIEIIQSDKIRKRHTIQLINTQSKQFTLDYVKDFKNKYPDLKDFIITYQSKDAPYAYGVGFSTFAKVSDAKVVLKNIQSRLNDSTLFIKNLENYTPLSSK